METKSNVGFTSNKARQDKYGNFPSTSVNQREGTYAVRSAPPSRITFVAALKLIGSLVLALTLVTSLTPSEAFAASNLTAGSIAQATTSSTSSKSDAESDSAPSRTDVKSGIAYANLIQCGNCLSSLTSTGGLLSAQSTTALPQVQNAVLRSRLTNALTNVAKEIDISDLKISFSSSSVKEIASVMSDVVNGNPDMFYVNNAFTYTHQAKYVGAKASGDYLLTIKPSYCYKVEQIPAMRTKYQNQMSKLLSWVPEGAGDMQKAKAVHDWLVRNCNYNYTAANSANYSSRNPWNAYGAIVGNDPVCQGYSLAFVAAMNRLGIPCTCVTQYIGSAGHAWNRVKLSGSWYNLDITWDDNRSGSSFSSTPDTTYFLKSDAWFKKNPSFGFHSSWSPQGVVGTNTRYDKWRTSDWPTYKGTVAVTSIKSFTLSNSTLRMSRDSTAKLTITSLLPSYVNLAFAYTRATWQSSDPSVVSVDGRGSLTTGGKSGTATVTCRLGSVSRTCKVTVKGIDISDSSITKSLSQTTLSYNGQTRHPSLSLARKTGSSSTPLVYGEDYGVTWAADSINAGTKSAVITGKGTYEGTARITYTITPRALNTASIPRIATRTYDGTAQKPQLKVLVDANLLVEGRDFTATYQNNTNAGTAKVVVKGIGNYSGTASGEFSIAKARVSTPTAVKNLTYTGKAQTGVLPGTGYTLKGNTATNPGTYTATATLSNNKNYVWTDGTSGQKSITWSIAPKAATGQKIANPATIKAKSLSSTATTLSRGNVVFPAASAFTVTDAKGSVSFSLYKIDSKAQGKISVSNNGVVTLKKGLAAGTYALTTKVTVAGDSQYKSVTRYVSTVVTVR